MGPVVRRFVEMELSPDIAAEILDVLRRRTHGIEELEFNIFYLRLDIDSRTVLVGDGVSWGPQEEEVPLQEFTEIVTRVHQQR